MDYRKLIAEAWDFTQNNKKMIIWFAFVPALLTTLWDIIYLTYQYYAFKSSPLFENWQHSFLQVLASTVLGVVRDNFDSAWPFIILAIIVAIFYFVGLPFCQGAMIQLIARKRNNQDVKTRHGLKYGMMSFLPLFEYSFLVRTFGIMAILGEAAFVIRNLGPEMFEALSPVFVIFLIASIALTLFFTYAEFFMVIDECGVFQSIVKSCSLVVRHLEATILLTILMIIITLRILLQIVFVIVIPAIIVGPIYFFASSTLADMGLVIGGILGVIALYLASYLSATIHVFAVAVWTFTFLELTHEEELSARAKA